MTLPALAVVSHPSKQGNMYRVPAGARKNGFDTVFLTGLYWRRSPLSLAVLRCLPRRMAERVESVLERRRLDDLDPNVVRRLSGPLPELLYRAAGYGIGNLVHDALAAGWIRAPVRAGPGGIFHGFQEAARLSLRAAERQGLLSLLEVTLPPTTNAILAAERRRLGLAPGPSSASPAFRTELSRCHYVVAQSLFSARSVMECGIEPGRIFVMPLGVDTDRFRPAARIGDGGVRALFTGQMPIRKGVHHLLDAWSLAAGPEDELLFAGYPSEPEVIDRVRRAGGRRRYLGFVPHDRLHEVYQQADFFVFPSLAEGGVYVIYEALACGLPCIVSANAGS